ncbi:uncharacterized protein LOC119992527 isoform X2 [Tripterygium wilfordii]|uniref:uncharacterized protein LOC119992527 isoform X2 n=1 Tax=Tripterygium wilfordii TaxID=458696 RepID=UPI0018F84897|nr:uncharacterized protein LOC119992527 isoform X2 [Tripterygium wilfordii]
MESGIDGDAPLDYATIQVFPSENRFEAFVCGNNKVEKLSVGLLEQLLPHLPGVNDLYAKGSNCTFTLELPEEFSPAVWFTKSTINRFLQIVAFTDFLNTGKGIEGEISQLEAARKFQLYLSAQVQNLSEGRDTGCNSIDTAINLKHESGSASSVASKNELLRAIDLRLTVLRRELAAVLEHAAGASFSSTEISELAEFYENFGATDLKNIFCKLLAMNQNCDSDGPLNEGKSSVTSNVHKIDSTSNVHKVDSDIQISKPVRSVTAVKYGVSPAKVAEIERLSSTESEESSDDSERNRTSADRSRARIRSASPRRSASPMRRIQIGRTGSRRPNSLTVKSLSHYPGRESSTSHRDVAANTMGDEGSERPSQKPENNARSLTVQDAINLFERKQKNQTADVQSRLSLTNISLSANKSVLRRWSAGMEKSSSQLEMEVASEDSDTMVPNDVDGMNSKSLVEVKQEPDLVSGLQNPVDTVAMSTDMQRGEKVGPDSVNIQQEAMVTKKVETNGGSTASLEWSSRKEAELNQMLKMMEKQPVNNSKHQPSRNQNLPSEVRGGFYNHYKEKRDEKLRGENAKKRTEKEAQFRAMQRILDERKAEMASANMNDVSKKLPLCKPQNSLKSLHHNENSKKETAKSSATKKVSSKPTPSPASRKSWPLTASQRSITAPAKAPAGISSGGITPTQRKSQPTRSLPRTSPKVERSQLRPRNLKESLPVNNPSLKSVNEKKQQPVKKGGRAAKAKVEDSSRDCSGIVPAKPSFYNKMTKKNSIVPLESKSVLRKGPAGSRVGPLVEKKKHSSDLEDSSKNCTTLTKSQENEVVVKTSVEMCEDHHDAPAEAETLASSTQSSGEMEKCNNEAAEVTDDFQNMAEPSLEILAEEELTISPSAWVEIEEHEDVPHPGDDCKSLLLSPADGAAIGLPSTRVRHSLSQMLQEESSELDNIAWGNAETHTAIFSAKDAPKGLKRLLKFARKSKGDATITGWSSPSVFYEGEENAEESGASSTRNTDNLLRKAALNVKTDGPQRSLASRGNDKYMNACELPSAQQNISKFEAQSSHRLHKGNVPASTSATKGTKSFFSLSAFRGSKPNETKIR